jgi:2-polyprenyl-3-methyl-5-hydroxy-6-metoxy-1,4-benzoquinol methylase
MNNKSTYLKVKDHSVSGEEFQLLYNSEFEMLETFPQPSLDKLPEYYKSKNYISHTDSKRNFVELMYHVVKGISLKRKLRLINSFSRESKYLLDVGCGTGDFLKIAQRNNWCVTGIEPDNDARQIANQKTVDSVYEAEELLRFKPNSFDVITLWHVLEHLPNLKDHISIFKKLLKPYGVLIIAVPNYKSYDAQHYKNYWAAYDVPRHLWHFSKTSISKLVQQHNFKVLKMLPMIFDAYYVSLLSEKYMSKYANPFKAFWVGWKSNFKASRNGEYSSIVYVVKNDLKAN